MPKPINRRNAAVKRITSLAAISVSVLLTACQQTQTSKPATENGAPVASPTAPAAPAAPAAVSTPAPAPAVAGEIIIDNDDPGFKAEGDWTSGSGGSDYKDGTLWATGTSGNDTPSMATWTPDIKTAGTYDVYEWHGDDPNSDHATNEPFTVNSEEGSKTIPVDLRNNSGKWNLLGTFKFAAGKGGNVSVSSKADGNVLADAVKFVPHQ